MRAGMVYEEYNIIFEDLCIHFNFICNYFSDLVKRGVSVRYLLSRNDRYYYVYQKICLVVHSKT